MRRRGAHREFRTASTVVVLRNAPERAIRSSCAKGFVGFLRAQPAGEIPSATAVRGLQHSMRTRPLYLVRQGEFGSIVAAKFSHAGSTEFTDLPVEVKFARIPQAGSGKLVPRDLTRQWRTHHRVAIRLRCLRFRDRLRRDREALRRAAMPEAGRARLTPTAAACASALRPAAAALPSSARRSGDARSAREA